MEKTLKEKKMELISRLVKDGSIDFVEALQLLETEKEYIYMNNPYPVYPNIPNYPRMPYYGLPVTTTGIIINSNRLSTSGYSVCGGSVVAASSNAIVSFTNN